jgi:hypothetical protein
MACGLEIDECYTASWRESKYTLIHTHKDHRLRKTAMDKIMQQMHSHFQIVGSELFGFDSVACNAKTGEASFLLEDHPGFRILVEKVNKEPIDLEWWTRCATDDLRANRKGLLWKHIESTDPSNMTRAQLVERVRKWTPVVREAEQLRKTNGILNEHNAALLVRNHELSEEVRKERAFAHELLMKQLSNVDNSTSHMPSS